MQSPWLRGVKKNWRASAPETLPGEQRKLRVRHRSIVLISMLLAALVLTTPGPARSAENPTDYLLGLLGKGRNKPVVCKDQTYALCAGASCFVFNDVAYCSCDVLKGNSVSAPFNYDHSNVCAVNANGVTSGYMVSTFSLPEAIVAPNGNRALYVCPRTSTANYAKCDGGICFTSTIGHSFPGSDTPSGDNQIVCSCPVERANPIQGLEIIGPYPCEEEFFRNCEPEVANSNTGATLYDGTSIGSTRTGIRILTGDVPPLNVCRKFGDGP
jgi:hypothetical protein